MGVKKVSSITSNKVDMKNIYKSNRRYTDRNAKSSEFPELDVKASKISTVLLLLQSSEQDVIEKALYHLDKFASLGNRQLYELTENRIYDFLLKLIKSENLIVKKFTFKLIVQLIHVVVECRKKMLTDDGLIEEAKSTFMASSDDNLVEFSCIILQYICNDIKQIDVMGRDEAFLRVLFKRFTSNDPDILLQSLQLLNLIMGNFMLISSILTMKDFPFKNLQIELKNDCQQIQMAALESLLIISNCEHPFMGEFASDRFIEVIYGMCLLSENLELHKLALKLYRNILKNDEKLQVKLSHHLPKFLQKFTDANCENREEMLSILIQFAAMDDNRKIMCRNEILKDIFVMIKENCSIEACNFVSVMSTNIFCLEEILSQNIYLILLDAVMNDESNWENKSAALLTFKKIINIHGLKYLEDIAEKMIAENLSKILNTSPPLAVKVEIISILEKLAMYSTIKSALCATNTLANAVYSTFTSSRRSTKLIIRLFHLIANYIDQETFRISFIEYKILDMIQHYLTSNVNQMRVAVCNLINMSSNYCELASRMVDDGILKSLLDNVDCSACSDGIESILDADLSLKFSVRRKLDVNDRITSGFYATRNKKLHFMKMREIMRMNNVSPIFSIYTVNFEDVEDFSCVERKILKDKNLQQLKNALLADENFKTSTDVEKFKILAKKVADFLQTNDDCTSHHFQMHIQTLKFKFSSSVIPLGSLIYGHSFEAAMLFKALADHVNLNASFVSDKNGKSWNEIFDGYKIVDLIFDIGEMYELNSIAGQKYLQRIS